jgi:hypothetical protein
LENLWLANNYTTLTQWAFPSNAIVQPGEFKVIFADGLTNLSTETELHAGFALSSAGGALALSRLSEGEAQVLDFVDYGSLPADYSYGSFPNGQSFERQPFYAVTPGSANITASLPALSYVPYDTSGWVYTQDFNPLPNPGATSVNSDNPVTINSVTYSLANPFGFASAILPSGNVGGLGLAELAGWYGAGDLGSKFGATSGDQTTGGVLSFGLPSSANRAVGLLSTSSTGPTTFAVKFLNNTELTLTRMSISFVGELWRQSNLPKTLGVSYLIDPTAVASFPTAGTMPLPNLNVALPTSPAALNGIPADGTSPLNQTNLAVVNHAINWPPGGALWLMWRMSSQTGKAQGLGIDDFTFAASTEPPLALTIQPSATNVTVAWPTLAGLTYQPEYNNDLRTTNWVPVGDPVLGTGGILFFTDDYSTSNRFFRLKMLSP